MRAKTISYAENWLPLHHRIFIHAVEILTGRLSLKRRYNTFQKLVDKDNSISPWDLALDVMGLKISNEIRIPKKRKGKGLLIIANHTYGLPDGLILGWIASKLDKNFRVISNNVLRQEPTMNGNILPIDFGMSRKSKLTNIETRKKAISQLNQGGVVAIFPAGGVAWSRKKGEPVKDIDWKPFTGRLIKSSGCDVLPVKFYTHNSALFQIASRIWNNKENVSIGLTLRYSLFIREIRKTLDKEIQFDFMDLISNEYLPNLNDYDLTQYLRLKMGV